MNVRLAPLALAAVALTAACNSDRSLAPSFAQPDEIVGTWISTGLDVAPGLRAEMRATVVRATFSENQTYTIQITDSTNTVKMFAGTWTATGTQARMRAITLTQTMPEYQVEQGVFKLDGVRLTYEVVPMQPSVDGLSPATIGGGFGSTAAADGAPSSTWIQRFWNEDANMIAPPCNPDEPTVTSKRPCEPTQWLGMGSKN
jgi:hypothetical protein